MQVRETCQLFMPVKQSRMSVLLSNTGVAPSDGQGMIVLQNGDAGQL